MTWKLFILSLNISLNTKKKEILGLYSILTFLYVGLGCTFKESNVTLRGCVKQKE